MQIDKSPIDYVPYTNRDPTWIRPELIAEIKFSDWTEEKIMRVTSEEINRANTDPSTIKVNGCTACHVLFSIVDKMHVNESEASDFLSQILFDDQKLK